MVGSICTDFALEVGKVGKFAVGPIEDTVDLELKLRTREAAKKDEGTEGVAIDEAFVSAVGFTEIGDQMLVTDLKVFEVFSVGCSLFES